MPGTIGLSELWMASPVIALDYHIFRLVGKPAEIQQMLHRRAERALTLRGFETQSPATVTTQSICGWLKTKAS